MRSVSSSERPDRSIFPSLLIWLFVISRRALAREVALTQFVEDDGEQDHDAEHDVLRVGLDVGEVDHVVEAADQERAEELADDRAAAAHHARAADDNGGDRLKLRADARLRRAGR